MWLCAEWKRLCYIVQHFVHCVYSRGELCSNSSQFVQRPPAKPKAAAPTIAPNKIVERKNFSCNQFGCQFSAIFCWTHTKDPHEFVKGSERKSSEKSVMLIMMCFFILCLTFTHLEKGQESLLYAFQPQLCHLHFEIFWLLLTLMGSVKAKKSTRMWC